jgi:hypothetical protein
MRPLRRSDASVQAEHGMPLFDDPTAKRSPATAADTTSAAHRVQTEVYRTMGGAARLAIAFQLTDTVRRLTLAGIRARHPAYGDEQVLHAYARLIFGDEFTSAAWPNRELVEP